jgi:hypothetical protein
MLVYYADVKTSHQFFNFEIIVMFNQKKKKKKNMENSPNPIYFYNEFFTIAWVGIFSFRLFHKLFIAP